MTENTLLLTFMNGPADGRRVSVHNPTVTIGSSPQSDVVIDFDPNVAGTHLIIEHTHSHWRLLDHSNGTAVFMDGQPIEQGNKLSAGSMLQLGNTLLKVDIAGSGG